MNRNQPNDNSIQK